MNLILLPGLHGTADLFAPLLEILPPEVQAQVIAYPTWRPRGYRALQQQLEAQLAGRRDLVLFAESFSGPLALRFAAQHPEQVRAIVLCVSFVGRPVPRLLGLLGAPLALIRFPIPTLALRAFLTGRRAPKSLVRATRRAIRANAPWVLADRVLRVSFTNAAAPLRQCRAPVLYLAGTRDRLIGRRALRRIQRLRPDVQARQLAGPHLLLQTNPTGVWEAVAEFVTGCHAGLRPACSRRDLSTASWRSAPT